MHELRLLTWNLLRHDSYRPYAWPTRLRRQALIRRLPEVDCQLACFQEVSPGCQRLLHRLLPGFAWHADPAAHHGRRAQEGLPIAWRSEHFTALDRGCLRLGSAPLRPGCRREPPRPASWQRLRAADGSRLLVANTHFGHEDERRYRDAAVLGERLAAIAGDDPVVVAGDFNSRPRDRVFAILAAHGLQRMPQRPRSLNLFGLPLLAIDAVLSSPAWHCSHLQRITGRNGLVFASDHFGLLATLRRHPPR